MSEQTTMGTLCALCGNDFIGNHCCPSLDLRARELHAPTFTPLDPRLDSILEELKAIRALLEARP